jgi:Protein of unknown function (DUF3102)
MTKSNARGVPAQADTALTTAALTEHATAIRGLGKRVAADVIEIGRRLADCRDHHLERGKWLPWLQTEFDWSERTALNFIRVWEQSKSANFADFDLPISSLYLLAAPSTPKTARKEIAKRAKGGKKIKHDDVKKIVKKHKAAKKSAAGKPESALVWKRLGHGICAETSAGLYTVDKLDYDVNDPKWSTHFQPDNKGAGPPFTEESSSLKAAKALAQTHHDKRRETGGGADQEPAGKQGETGDKHKGALGETAAAPDAPLTRSEILHADGYWAVFLANNDIDGARKIHALLLDDERRTVFTEALGKAISAVESKDREALVDVLADALGVTDKTASDANGANGNDINQIRSSQPIV